jgi:DNA mismatch endonuclease (patch repair protein)
MAINVKPFVEAARSRQMALVKGKNTKPEIIARRFVHSLGYRFRLHRRDLPGVPDLVFPGRRKVIFVHGCFWHQHDDPACWRSRVPKTRQEFWRPKLEGNVARDRRNLAALKALGWDALVLWECQTTITKRRQLEPTLRQFLGSHARGKSVQRGPETSAERVEQGTTKIASGAARR